MDSTDSKPAKASRKGAKAKARAEGAASATETVEGTAAKAGLKKKDLVERVSSAVGSNRGSVKDVVEATLIALASSVQAGEAMNLPPLGRLKVVRSSDKGDGKGASVTIRITSRGDKKAAGEPLAAESEEG